jgi:2-polyprenyl-6-methoxyphenol hydroxylase-like FAD-dependent oxidoreductase
VTDVLIVGGGPVGLFLGIRLLQCGVRVRILEERLRRSEHSRAIGIHPPALDALADAGVCSAFVAEGVRIPGGVARCGGADVSALSFARVSPSHPFVLSLPQMRTEQLLEEELLRLDPDALHRGVRVTGLRQDPAGVLVQAERAGVQLDFRAALAVGADGTRSAVRAAVGAASMARTYPDTYLMGDFRDTTGDGPLAVLHLEPGGIVESFPLPGGIRRWVAHTDALAPAPTPDELAELIAERTGHRVEVGSNTMLSAFGVRSRMVRAMVHGRTALIGDAAHEISPIGGQGMNLGWLDAAALAPVAAAALRGGTTGQALKRFDTARRRAAGRALRRSELNMVLGRPMSAPALRARNAVVARALNAPGLREAVARRFTMQA